MPTERNESKRPRLETLDESIKRVLQDAKFEDRTVNQAQYNVLKVAYESISTMIGGKARINLHPAFSSGGVILVTEAVSLSADEVSKLRSILSECTALSIEPLTNGNVEIGVTVPNVFFPLSGGTTE